MCVNALESARAHLASQYARVRGRRALDGGLRTSERRLSRTLRQRLQPVSLALDVRLAALQGWVLEALQAPGA
jgi:hypothetical protein